MDDLKARVLSVIEAQWDEQVQFLRELVRFPSVLFDEAPVQMCMYRTFRQMGLRTDMFEADPARISRLPGYSPVEWGYRGRPQVVGVLPSRVGGGRSLVLNGHVDVVSPEPLRLWSYDPWGAQIDGDRLYGRGALDMKSGVAGMVYAVKALQRAGVELKGDLILQSVIEEECTGNGTLACLARGYVGDGALIPEPWAGEVLAGELGVLWLRTVVTGAAGHVFGAHGHVNAIEKAYELIRALRDLEARWNANPHPAYAGIEHPINFNPGVIRGGDWPSTVPAECQFVTRLSFYPGITPEQAKAAVLAHLQGYIKADPWFSQHPPEFTWYGHHDEGFVAPENDPLLAVVGGAHTQVTGRPAVYRVGTAVTDARFWPLYYGKPATCYGPSGGNSHAPDEWVHLRSLLESTKVMALAAMDWCGVA